MFRALFLILGVSTLRGDDSLRRLSREGGACGADEDVDRTSVLQVPHYVECKPNKMGCGHEETCGQLCFQLYLEEADVYACFNRCTPRFRNVASALDTFCAHFMCDSRAPNCHEWSYYCDGLCTAISEHDGHEACVDACSGNFLVRRRAEGYCSCRK
mmetsp:Transcript_12487/g.35774  ORF Transcript_12487/g.35774 Transcript_12487/m.35774 type:complete len:157 (+) Transcript_12487:61-531(+)